MDIPGMFLADGDGDTLLLCPVCKFDYVHIEKAEIDQNSLKTHVAKEACVNIERKASTGLRGSMIRIWFWCENRHRFEMFFRFHKGRTFTEVEQGKDHNGNDVKELWRD
jgi:hypothetical protein